MEDVRVAAPARYMARGRETIDRIRDVFHARYDSETAEEVFLAWCIGRAVECEISGDLPGLDFRRAMVRAVVGADSDPRSVYPGFDHYTPHPVDEDEVRRIVLGGA